MHYTVVRFSKRQVEMGWAYYQCRCLAVCLLAFLSVQAWADQQVLVLKEGQNRYEVAGVMRYLRDSTHALRIDDLQNPELIKHFKPTRPNYMVLGLTDDPYWFYFRLRNQMSRQDWFFNIRYFGNGRAEVFLREPGLEWQQAGFLERNLERHYFLPLTLKEGVEYEVALRSHSPGPDKFAVFIVDDQAKEYFTVWDNRWLGVFYGSFATLILYNLFVALSMRSVTYGFYVLYLLGVSSYLFAIDGFGQQLFWGESIEWSRVSYYVFACLMVACGCLFAKRYLQTSVLQPSMDRVLNLMILFSLLLLMVLSATGEHPLLTGITMLLASLYALVIFAASLTAYLKGNRMARYFLLAWLFPEVGVIYTTAMYSGLTPFNEWGYNALHFASLVEAILLSLALADRINILQQEKESAVVASRNRLQQSNESLERTNAMKDAFLGTVSHELRTPMNGVIASLELLKARPLGETEHALLDAMSISSETMMQLVERILNYSELLSGKAQVNSEVIEIRQWLSEQQEQWKAQCEEKNLNWQYHIDPDVSGAIKIDPYKVGLLLSELIGNAIKFTSHGTVTLNIDGEDDAQTQILRFSVSDEGIGIPEAKLKEIFQSFYQVQHKYDRQYGGLGIGLAIAKEIADLLSGKLMFRPKDNGLHVDFVLPCKRVSITDSKTSEGIVDRKEEPANPLEQSTGLLILIVEDNPVNQMVLKKIVHSLGHDCRVACDGEEAVTMADQQVFDLIFMDCQMPHMDGFEATRIIRSESNANRATPIVAVTANAMEGDRQRCLDAGMNDYLKKPVKPAMIEDIVQKWVAGQAGSKKAG